MNQQEEFDKNGYTVVKCFLNEGMTKFLYEYLTMKDSSMRYMIDNGFVYDKLNTNSIGVHYFGITENPDNKMGIGGCYSCYADPAMETLLGGMTDIIGNLVGKSLLPTYSFCRLYIEGNELKEHTDRPACEISATLCLGYEDGTPWEIKMGDTSVAMEAGDVVIYKGIEIPHSREKYKGKKAGQVFLHYVDKNGKYFTEHGLDGRPCLGVPSPAGMASNQNLNLFIGDMDSGIALKEGTFFQEDKLDGLKTVKAKVPWTKLV